MFNPLQPGKQNPTAWACFYSNLVKHEWCSNSIEKMSPVRQNSGYTYISSPVTPSGRVPYYTLVKLQNERGQAFYASVHVCTLFPGEAFECAFYITITISGRVILLFRVFVF